MKGYLPQGGDSDGRYCGPSRYAQGKRPANRLRALPPRLLMSAPFQYSPEESGKIAGRQVLSSVFVPISSIIISHVFLRLTMACKVPGA